MKRIVLTSLSTRSPLLLNRHAAKVLTVGGQRRALAHDNEKHLATRLLAGSLLSTVDEEKHNLQLEVNSWRQSAAVNQIVSLYSLFFFFLSSLCSANQRDLEAGYIDPQPYSMRPAAAHSQPI